MTKLWQHILKYLPIMVGVIILCTATNVFAGVGDWAVDKASLAAAKALGIDTTDNCVPPQSHTSCLFCPMFKILYNAGNAVASKAYKAFHSDLGKLVCLFLCVSLALIILKNIASMSSQDPGTLVNDILNKVFIGIAIFIIVTQDYHNILNLTLVPIFTSGMEFVSIGGSGDLQNCGAAAGIAGFSGPISSNDDAGIPTAIGKTLICTADYIESKIDTLFEYGRWGFCRGMGPDRFLHIIPHPIYLIDALLLYLGGIFFIVAYPWVLGDAVLQLGISMALLPFAVAGYAFNGTKKYLSTVFSWILNTLFVFMFMVILITCVLVYIQNIIVEAANSTGDPKILFTDPVRGIAFFGANMFMVLFVLMIGYTYMPQVDELAGQFAKGSALSAAQQFGTFLTDQMDKQVSKVGDKAAAVAGDAVVTTGRVTARRMRAGVRRGAMAMTNKWGKDDGAGNKRLSIAGLSFTTAKNADGSTYLKREFTNPLNGRKHIMVSDKYSTIRQEYDRNGNLIKSKVEFKHSFAKNHLLNKDGTINMGAYRTLMDSDLAKDPEFKKALMAQVATTVLKAKGKDIGVHFEARNVTIDPSNPNRIIVEQIDNTGKKTNFSMNIDAATGKVAVNFTRSRDRNRFEKAAHSLNVGSTHVGNNSGAIGLINLLSFGRGKFNLGFIKYEVKHDSLGRAYYEREIVGRKNIGRKINIWGATKLINTLSFGRGKVNLGFIKYEVKRDALGQTYYERDVLARSGAILRPWTWRFKRNKKQYGMTGTNYINGVDSAKSRSNAVDNQFSDYVESFFDNGSFTTSTTGYRDPNTGIISGEQTKFTYSAAVQNGHASIASNNELAQVVDSSGNLSSAVDRNDFLFGIEEYLKTSPAFQTAYTSSILPNATTEANAAAMAAGIPILPGDPAYDALLNATIQKGKEDFILNNLFAAGRRRRSNRVRSSFGIII